MPVRLRRLRLHACSTPTVETPIRILCRLLAGLAFGLELLLRLLFGLLSRLPVQTGEPLIRNPIQTPIRNPIQTPIKTARRARNEGAVRGGIQTWWRAGALLPRSRRLRAAVVQPVCTHITHTRRNDGEQTNANKRHQTLENRYQQATSNTNRRHQTVASNR